MNILMLTQVVPYPPDSGPKVKTFNVLRYLAARHEVHLVSFTRSAEEVAAAQALKSACASVTTVGLQRSTLRDLGYLARSLVTGQPFLIQRDASGAMHQSIATLLARQHFDAVHADQLGMAQFAVDLPLGLRVLDQHNAVWTIVRRSAAEEHWGPRKLLAELEWRKLKSYEGRVSRQFDRVLVVSEQDNNHLADAAGSRITSTQIPIAIDTEALGFHERTAESQHVLSVATMFYPPNVEGVLWFARRVFPLIQQSAPGASFLVVGSRPPAVVQHLNRENPGIVVTGYVSDLDPVLHSSAVLIVPVTAGSGMRVKILEAFARGIPVVSTSVGVEGIEARNEEHLLIADEPEDFAHAVTRLLLDHAEGNRLARAARSLVESKYDWRTTLGALDAVYATTEQRGNPPESVEDDVAHLEALTP